MQKLKKSSYQITRKEYLITATYNDFNEVMEFIKPTMNDQTYYSHSYSTYDHFCEDTWEQALDKLQNGWKNGVARIQNISDSISDNIEVDRFTYGIQKDVVGDYIDIGDAIAGDPECFGRIELMPGVKKDLFIVINVGYSAGVSAETIYNRGAVIVNMVERLRRRYHVILLLTQCVQSITSSPNITHPEYDLRIQFLMDTTRDFSRDLLSFYLANSAFLRRIIFHFGELLLDTHRCGSSYGIPYDDPSVPNHAIVFSALKHNSEDFASIKNATKYLKELLLKYK